MENKDTSSHDRKYSSFLDYINSNKDISDEMRNRLKERIEKLGDETVLKAFLNIKKRIVIELKRKEEERKAKADGRKKEEL